MMSPGPSWTVLAQPPSSSPSTRTSIRSELDTDVDMGDDEAEHEPDPVVQPPISKRKALPEADSPSARKHKQPRLDVSGTTTSPSCHAAPPRTQPGPPPSRLRSAASLTQARVQSAESASTSDFPNTITERLQRVLAREREEKERQRQKEREAATAETRTTARKQTTHPKNVRRVSTASLLKNAQTRPEDTSAAWTRVRPKLKPKRTNMDAETAATRPLAVARQRDSDVIELTDSTDSTRPHPRPSVARPPVLANMDDPIVITSSSEDEPPRTQRRKSGPQTQRPRVRAPPPADAEVISLTDSDEDVGATRAPPATAPAAIPASTTARAAESTSASTSTQLPEQAALQNTEPPRSSPAPSYEPPPDDLDDPFGNIDFGTGGDPNPPDDWDGLSVGTSLATIPVPAPSADTVPVGTRGSEGPQDDALFNSYLNMDQMTTEGAPPAGGSGGDEQVAEDRLENSPAPTRQEEGPSEESPNADGRDKDMPPQNLEEGEVAPNDAAVAFVRSLESGEILSQEPTGQARVVSSIADVRMQNVDKDVQSMRAIGTPESGEIRSQGSGMGSGSRPPSSAPSSGSVATTPPSTSTPALAQQSSSRTASLTSSSASPGLPASQPPKRTGILVMPDITPYMGMRFKRPEAVWENSFFSRALNGRPSKVPASVGEKKARGSPLASVDAPSLVDKVRSLGEDADMQIASTSEGAATYLSPQQPAVLDTQSTMQAQQSPTMDASTTIDDVPPSSTQPAPASIRETPSEPPATQPASSSSRPFIAPPRIPRPSTPVSLVDVLNEVRRDKLLKDELQLARKRSIADITTEHATPPMSASQPVSSPPVLPVPLSTPTLTQTPTPSQTQATRAFGRAPSLKNIRELLKRNVRSPSSTPKEDAGGTPARSPVAAPAPQPRSVDTHEQAGQKSSVLDTPTPSTTVATASLSAAASPSAKPRRVSLTAFEVPLSVSAPAPVQPKLVDAHERVSELVTGQKNNVLDTPTPSSTATTCGPVATGTDGKRRDAPFGPFEAFISPARPPKASDKVKRVDASPTVQRPRVSTGVKERHRRRVSTAAAFEAYIVRDSPRERTRVRRAETDRDGDEGVNAGTEVGHVVSQMPETERIVPMESADVPELVGDGGGDEVDDANRMPERVSDHRDGTSGANEIPDRESDEEAEGVDDANENNEDVADDATHVNEGEEEVDETDALLELASVHLSQTNLDAEAETAVAPESTGKPADAGDVDMQDELPAAGDASSPGPSNEMAIDEPPKDDAMDEQTDPQLELVDVPETWTSGTTPDLILPEDPLPFTSEQNSNYGQAHERHVSGDSVEECDALLVAPGGVESESEGCSSKTASSTSLAPPPIHSRQRSPPIDSPNLLHLPALIPDDPEDDRCEYRIITFESRVAEERERPPKYKLSKDIPHSLQDYVKGVLPESYRKSKHAREAFEAHILESMGNEPDTPPIKIFDNNIGEEWTPEWEFHYTNEMWFGEGVPPPDRRGLVGCGCVGKCDPKSSTCLCAKRQLEWVQKYIDKECIPATWPGSPFLYDHKGSLQQPDCPIFECNRFCSCDEDCPNRVVQNGRKWPVHITRTQDKGWGVIAGDKKIPKGSYLGIYAGELLTEQEGEARGRYYDTYGRTYLFSIDFHHLKIDIEDPEEFENMYVVDAYHAGNFTRFLNHSCDPNCGMAACYIDDADINKPLLVVFTIRDVEPGEELCFSYYGDIEEKREEMQKAGPVAERGHAVYTKCWCGADNCIGRLFS